MSPKPARWYGNTGFNIVVFVLLFFMLKSPTISTIGLYQEKTCTLKFESACFFLVKAKANLRVHVFFPGRNIEFRVKSKCVKN